MKSEQQLKHRESTESVHGNHYTSHARCLCSSVECFNLALDTATADDIKGNKVFSSCRSDNRANNLYVLDGAAFGNMMALPEPDRRVPGVWTSATLVIVCDLTCGQYAFTAQKLNRATECRLVLGFLPETQERQPVVTQVLLQIVSNQAAQTQHQMTRTNFPALACFELLVKDTSPYHQKRYSSNAEFDLSMGSTEFAVFRALTLKTISCPIASLTKNTVCIFEVETGSMLDKPALDTACETLN